MAARLAELTPWLREHASLWRPRPFLLGRVPWEDQHPAMSAWLRDLDEATVTTFEADDRGLIEAPEPLSSLLTQSRKLAAVPASVRMPLSPVDAWRPEARATERKRAQVQALVETLAATWPEAPGLVVDWCAGKGHLGRSLAAVLGRPLLTLERQRRLCEVGQILSAEAEVAATHLPLDVRQTEQLPCVAWRQAAVVGLHACGSLGEAMLDFAVAQKAETVALAPCCYHFAAGARPYRPRSAGGRAHDLHFDETSLRLPTYQQVRQAPSIGERRRRKMAWLMALKALTEAAGAPLEGPPGPVYKGWNNDDLPTFVARMAGRRGVALPSRWDADAIEALGWERARHARALGLVRGVFRRPLELWLVLDKALALQGQGYEVALTTFCAPSLTPRNLLIHGVRAATARRWHSTEDG